VTVPSGGCGASGAASTLRTQFADSQGLAGAPPLLCLAKRRGGVLSCPRKPKGHHGGRQRAAVNLSVTMHRYRLCGRVLLLPQMGLDWKSTVLDGRKPPAGGRIVFGGCRAIGQRSLPLLSGSRLTNCRGTHRGDNLKGEPWLRNELSLGAIVQAHTRGENGSNVWSARRLGSPCAARPGRIGLFERPTGGHPRTETLRAPTCGSVHCERRASSARAPAPALASAGVLSF
jgi:hypothetical protein